MCLKNYFSVNTGFRKYDEIAPCFENLRLIGRIVCELELFLCTDYTKQMPQNGNFSTCGTCGRTVDVAAFEEPLLLARRFPRPLILTEGSSLADLPS